MATFDDEDEFRTKVAAQLGKGRIAESIWERAYDWAIMERYEDAAKRLRGELPKVAAAQARTEQREAVDEQAQVVAGLYTFVVDASNELRDGVARFDRSTSRESTRPSKSVSTSPDIETERLGAFVAALSEYEQDRAWAASRELSSIAGRVSGSRIQRFRKNQLDGATLDTESAARWIRSPLTILVNPTILRQMHWSPLTQPATLGPPERLRDQQGHDFEQVTLTVAGEPTSFRRGPRDPLAALTMPSGERVEFWKWSLGAELMKLATRLADRLPWTADEAAWFVLTGDAPAMPPLRGTFDRWTLRPHWQNATLLIEVEPWVSVESVANLYRTARRRVMPEQSRPHPTGLAVWRFVENQHAAAGPTLRDLQRQHPGGELRALWRRWQAKHPDVRSLTLRDVSRRWNAAHPDDQRAYSRFRRALLSGLEHADAIAFPDYRMLTRDELEAGDSEP